MIAIRVFYYMIQLIEKNSALIQKCLLGIFVMLCFLHFFSGRPTWLDENYVLASLTEFDYKKIFGVLRYEQAYPRIHLSVIKFISEPFNFHVYGLRIISLLSMIGAYFVWFKIYRRNIKDVLGFLLCMLAFACSFRMVYYAAELKPYATDVLSIALFTLYIIRQNKISSREINIYDYLSVALLPFLNLFAYATFFIFWIVVYNFLLLSFKDKKFIPLLVVSGLFSVLSVVALYFTDLQHVLHSKARQNYWESYFICSESVACFFDTFGEGIKRLVTFWFGNIKLFVRSAVVFIPFAVFACIICGVKSIWQNKGRITSLDAIGFVLVVVLFIFGWMHRYPFTGDRITLFFAPFAYYFIYRGLNWIPHKWLRIVMLGYFMLFCLVCLINTFIAQIRLY